jgi:phosphate starvation-inducible PhoH-like protein
LSRGQKRRSNSRNKQVNRFDHSDRIQYTPSNNYNERVYAKVDEFTPLNLKQSLYFELLENNQIVVATGEPGTGKTLCPVVYALDKLRDKSVDVIYITKPIVEVGKSMGYLPGKVGDKFAPYMDSILEHVEFLVGKQEKDRLLMLGKLKCIPLEFMRGSNLDNCVIIADEMQNAEYIQSKTLLTRLKENTKLILTGDLGQCDLTEKPSLTGIMEVLSSVDNVGFVHFEVEDILRSGIVKDLMLSFRAYEANNRR